VIDGVLDVVVAGGGPAGSATAIGCARAGLDVLLLDDGRGGRPGETLHPGVGVLLGELGVATDGFLRHAGHRVQWGGPARFEAFGADADGPWLGYQAPRAVLDARLLDAAEAAGARVLRGGRAARPVVDDGRVVGVVTDDGPLPARVVVDAGGRRHWLARHLGTPVRRVSRPLVAAYGYVAATDHPGGSGAEPVLRADGDGWTWVAPITAGTCAWTRLRPRGGAGWADPPAELAAAPPLGPVRGADVTWRHTAAAGPGWFLVGDAAAVLDPAASHGVLRALMSGMLAAHAVAGTRHGRLDPEHAAAGFRRWTLAWFRHDTARLDALYRLLPGRWAG
jgi:flavin-dependent dehydrogenase